jgi:hypothetical protein
MRTQRFQTRTERSEFCDAHDVSGCGETTCRAKALGMTVERYNAWIVAPAKMTITRGRSN